MAFRRPNATQLVSAVLFMMSAVLVGASVYMNASVDVLEDWRLELPQQEVHAGDTLVVQSIYKKTLDVSGKATRYIECQNPSGVYIRYPISEAVANRASGSTGTGVVMVVPLTIPDVPTTCRVNITIDYEVLLWRHVIESVNSSEFKLLPARQGGEGQGTSQNQGVDSAQIGSGVSYPNNTTSINPAQRDISQGDNTVVMEERQLSGQAEEAQAKPQPTLLDWLSGLLGGSDD